MLILLFVLFLNRFNKNEKEKYVAKVNAPSSVLPVQFVLTAHEKMSCEPHMVISWRDIMACERAKHSSCSVFGCTNEHKSLFPLPSSAPLKNKWVDFIFSINASVCAKHFTDDCFLNLGKYRAGLEPLEIKSGSVPSLLGSATDLGQVSQLIYHCVALLYVVTLLPLL